MSKIRNAEDLPDEVLERMVAGSEEILRILGETPPRICFLIIQTVLYSFIHITVPHEKREECLNGIVAACRDSFKRLDEELDADLSES
jgi:hypothetical protein